MSLEVIAFCRKFRVRPSVNVSNRRVLVEEVDCVIVTDIYPDKLQGDSVNSNIFGNSCAVYAADPHIYRNTGDLAVSYGEFKVMHSDWGINAESPSVFRDEAVIVNVLGHAADTVSAHCVGAAVSVVELHERISLICWKNEDQAVSTNALVPVGDDRREFFGVIDFLLEAVDVNVIITAAVHLSELHDECSPL